MALVLKAVVESVGNEAELLEDVIRAISEIVRMHPRWVNLGLAFIEAFDQIDLAAVRKRAKATGVRPLRDAIATLIFIELERILGPSVLPKPPKPPRVKIEPKPPLSVTRVPGVAKNVELGLELVKLRATIKNNRAFGRRVRGQFDIEAQHACETMKVARMYGHRPEIYTRLSWDALLALSAVNMPTLIREGLEARILAGEAISGPSIRQAA